MFRIKTHRLASLLISAHQQHSINSASKKEQPYCRAVHSLRCTAGPLCLCFNTWLPPAESSLAVCPIGPAVDLCPTEQKENLDSERQSAGTAGRANPSIPHHDFFFSLFLAA